MPMQHLNSPVAHPTESSGTIALADGYKFHWMLGGTRCPEVYGYTSSPDGCILARSGGWFRTVEPKEAARIAHWNLFGDGLVESAPTQS